MARQEGARVKRSKEGAEDAGTCPTGVLAISELLYNTKVYWRPNEVFVKRFAFSC